MKIDSNKVTRKEILNYGTFGEFCRACRKKSKISQTEVGEMIGYSGNYISDFERGQVDSLTIAYFYAIYFGATIGNYIRWCTKNQVEIFNTDLRECFMRSREFRTEIQNLSEDKGNEQLYLIKCRNELNAFYDIKNEL